MERTTTMIMAGGRGSRLFPLTKQCAKPAIRFGGIYRIIDFTLSNCLNSGIRRIYLLTQYASTSVERYIRHGWALLFRSEFHEIIETRPPQHVIDGEWYQGTAHCIYMNMDLVRQERQDNVLILSGDHIYKMDYRKMLEFHRDENADLTIACVDLPLENAQNMGVIEIDDDFRVKSFEEKPEFPKSIPGDPTKALCNMGVYLFRTKTLNEVLKADAEDNSSQHDFGRNIIPNMLNASSKVMCYLFWDENKKASKYWRDIGTLDAYYEANADLVEIDPLFNLYDNEWPVRGFFPQSPPAKTVFNWGNENRIGLALDSLLSPGVIISGGKVEHSILSPNVKVHSFSQIYNSIILDNVEIGRSCFIRNAIIDSNVIILPGTHIGLNPESDRQNYTLSDRGIVVVTKSEDF